MLARSRTRAIALTLALALVAGACGGSDDGSSSSDVVDSASDSEEPTTATQGLPTPGPRSSGSPDGDSDSPIGDLLGLPIADDEAMEEYFNDLGAVAELKVAECMIARGFEYTIVDYGGIGAVTSEADFESREFAEQYGFGIASNPFEEAFERVDSLEDPNAKYIEALSPGELDAYQTALSGAPPESTDDFQGFEPGGCQGAAFQEVFSFFEVLDEFQDEFDAFEEQFEADPRILDASSGWVACISEAGYRFADVDGAESDIRRRYNAILADPSAFAEGEPGDNVAAIEEDGEETFFFGPGSLAPESQQQVDELAVEERAIATASWDCNAPLREIEGDVQREYEQRFVDENGAAITEALGG